MFGSGNDRTSRNHAGSHRFYNPPAVRLQLQQQQQQRPSKTKPAAASEAREAENRVESDDSNSKASVCSLPQPQLRPASGNLDRFLESTTPVVPAQYFSKTSMGGWRNYDAEFHPYFSLGDLWESFKEWSAYGAGVPLVLNGIDSVVQYYVPFLSGIQLYVDASSKPSSSSRRPGEESDADSYRDTSSDGSSDSELDRSKDVSQGALGHHNLIDSSILRINRLTVRDKSQVMDQEGVFSDDVEVTNRHGIPIFEYFERDMPYSRKPLADKISVLASLFPGLKAYRSCDLLPASWLSVAWYPIYRIPTGPTLRDLEACFLTYHFLSTPLRSSGNAQPLVRGPTIRKADSAMDLSPTLSLPSFGLASYKFRGPVWTTTGVLERQQATSLLQAADNWLRRLQVEHPDFQFFVSHNTHLPR